MKIPYIFLVCTIIFEICFAQYLDENEVADYLIIVQNAVLKKVNDYGLSNLPDVDSKIHYNITDGASYDIKGDLYLENGFVMELNGINCTQHGHWTGNRVGNYTATIIAELKFGLTISRDFRFEAEQPETIPDETVGNVFIRPEEFYFDFTLAQNLINYTVTGSLNNKIVQGRVSRHGIEFHPENILTARLRKGRPYGEDLYPGLGALWKPIFDSFLGEIGRSIKFPSVKYPTTRSLYKK